MLDILVVKTANFYVILHKFTQFLQIVDIFTQLDAFQECLLASFYET